MNTLKSRLIIAAAVSCGVAFGIAATIAVQNAKKQDTRQEQFSADSDSYSDTGAVLPDTAKQEADVHLYFLNNRFKKAVG